MATTNLRRDAFDRDREFVVGKSLTLRGRPFGPGDAFDKTLVSTRRLRQLYDSRYLKMSDAQTATISAVDPDAMSDNQLILYLEDNGVVPRFGASRTWLVRKVREVLKNAEAVAGA